MSPRLQIADEEGTELQETELAEKPHPQNVS
jgi:hypothetical protein